MKPVSWFLSGLILFFAAISAAQVSQIPNWPPRSVVANAITKNVILGGTGGGQLSVTGGTVQYIGIGNVNGTESQNQIPLPIAGTLTKFYAQTDATITSGSWAISVDLSATPGSAGTTTSLCTITSQTCNATVSLPASAGNVLTITTTASSSPVPSAARHMHYGFEYDVASANTTIVWFGASGSAGTAFVGPGINFGTGLEASSQVYMPVASLTNGAKNLYVEAGTSTSRTNTLDFGGSSSGLTCAMSSAFQCHDTTHTATVSVGTLADLSTVFTATGAIINFAFELDTSTYALSLVGSGGTATHTATFWHSIGGDGNGSSTVSNQFQAPMPFAGSLKSANYQLTLTTPNSGTWTPQTNKGASSAIACSGVTGSTTSCNATGSVSYSAGDTISSTITGASTPNALTITWSGEFDPS